jgi:hypothetical protein
MSTELSESESVISTSDIEVLLLSSSTKIYCQRHFHVS